MKKKRFLGVLFSLALMLGMSLTAYAADDWMSSFTTDGGTIDGGVTLKDNITLTIPEGTTLTVNGGINAGEYTLTVTGGGTLAVTGVDGSGDDPKGDPGINGNVTVTSGTVEAIGGSAHARGSQGVARGGAGIKGNVTVNGGTVNATGGNATSDIGATVGTGIEGSIILGTGVKLYGSNDSMPDGTGDPLATGTGAEYTGNSYRYMMASYTVPSYTVTLTGGKNATPSGGDTTQSVSADKEITSVTYTANAGYYFAAFTGITNNGVTATWSDDKTVTVSGTPTADAEITVPNAEKEASEENGTPAKIVIGDKGSNAKSVSEYVNDPANANKLQEVTQMELTDSTTLTDLSGIEKLTNLQELNVSGSTSLATANLSKNTNLQKVNLKGCANLETVDVSGCKNLQALNVSGTAVTELDVSGCTALVSLDVSSGDLEGLKMENCPKLAYLDCSKNSLLSLDLSGFEKLVSADCHSQDRTGLTSAKQNDGTWKVALPDGLATGTVRVSAAGFVTDSVKVYDKGGNLLTATAAGTYASQPATVKYNYNTGYTDKASGKDVLMDVTLTGSGVSPTPGYNGPTSSKGSGGCDAGLGVMALAAALPLLMRKKR